jgi:hypothetical protein
MKKTKTGIFAMATLLLFAFTFALVKKSVTDFPLQFGNFRD